MRGENLFTMVMAAKIHFTFHCVHDFLQYCSKTVTT